MERPRPRGLPTPTRRLPMQPSFRTWLGHCGVNPHPPLQHPESGSASKLGGFGGYLSISRWLSVWLGTGDPEHVAWPVLGSVRSAVKWRFDDDL